MAILAVVSAVTSPTRVVLTPKGITSEGYNGHIVETPSRVPEREPYGMGRNDRLGIKPLCTTITSKGGLVDCIEPEEADAALTGAQGGVAGDSRYLSEEGVEPDDCQKVCYFCRTSMLTEASCSKCSCGLWPAPLVGNPVDVYLG